jgi:polar amino acid transport system substrate-binding protein|tara:strand:- start:97 stop:906 length:810 start_codon:yes stop_codon:yes gene_type:complete
LDLALVDIGSKFTKTAILSVLLILIASNARAEQSITVVGDSWAPYNAVPNSTNEGYFIDILREIFEPQKIAIKYYLKPWKRAVQDVRSGEDTALLGPFKSEAPDFVFPKQEVGKTSLVFFTHSSSDWEFSGVNSLKNIQIGIINGYDYRPWLLDYVRKTPGSAIKLSGTDAIERNLKMLMRGRIDAIPSNYTSFMYRAKKLGLDKKVRFAGKDNIGKTKKLYIAFSPNFENSVTLATMFDAGISALRKSGRLSNILQKYGLKDWRDKLD